MLGGTTMELTKMREFSEFHFHKGHSLIEDNDNYKSLMDVKNGDYDKIACEDPDAVDYDISLRKPQEI